jgi:hypothetical protein
MNIKGSYALVAGVLILLVGGAIFYYVVKTLGTPTTDIVADDDSLPSVDDDSTVKHGLIALQNSHCVGHTDTVLTCGADAISGFPETIIRDTHTGGDCLLSYDPKVGFQFKGNKKSGIVAAGDFEVTTDSEGHPVSLARSTSRSISLHVGSDGNVDHILFVADDFTTEQCLTLPE